MEKTRGRALKERVREILRSGEIEQALEQISQFPFRQTVNPLFSFLYSKNPELKWAAVTAMGHVTAKLAFEDMESARVVVRRLMWNLNDESGGIGWGSPEALGEILAGHPGLAGEYAPILVSYAMKDGNYLEHEQLQCGLIWAIGRVAQANHLLMQNAAPHLLPFLGARDSALRGHGAWTLGLLGRGEARLPLEHLLDDPSDFLIYIDRKLLTRQVKEVAKEALKRI
ncbi:MAG: DVU0298 family protein [Pseudomonadota bacterium]